jgi:hypothetical protein
VKIITCLSFCPAPILLSALLLVVFPIPNFSETKSGFWININPSASSQRVAADLSELTPFCSANETTFYCPFNAETVDFSIYLGSIRAPGGIQYDSALGAAIQAECFSGKQITRDREGLFYLDSMVKKRALAAPTTGYRDSCSKERIVYFLKTKEGNFATMIKIGEYIGGIDRLYYYWACRPENDGVLYKTALFAMPESLSITVDAFSGRPNPVFTLKDSAGIVEIVRQIYLSVNTLLDPSLKRTETIQCFQGLGYRKLTVSGMFDTGDVPNSSYTPSLDICNAAITYYKVSPVSSVMPPQQLYDPNRRLEKLIIRVCCRLGLKITDSFGEVQFCALIPDSLKDENGIQTDRRIACREGGIRMPRMNKGRIVFTVPEEDLYCLEILDTRGKLIGSIEKRFGPGEHAVTLDRSKMGAGVYLVRVRAGRAVVVQGTVSIAL